MSRISELRKKPKHVRDNIAFVAAGVVTLPIMAYLVFAVHGPKLTESIAGGSEKTDTKFFETFTNQVKEQVANVRQATTPAATSSAGVAPVIDRGSLDAVPVNAPVKSTSTATTTYSTTSVGVSASSSLVR